MRTLVMFAILLFIGIDSLNGKGKVVLLTTCLQSINSLNGKGKVGILSTENLLTTQGINSLNGKGKEEHIELNLTLHTICR